MCKRWKAMEAHIAIRGGTLPLFSPYSCKNQFHVTFITNCPTVIFPVEKRSQTSIWECLTYSIKIFTQYPIEPFHSHQTTVQPQPSRHPALHQNRVYDKSDPSRLYKPDTLSSAISAMPKPSIPLTKTNQQRNERHGAHRFGQKPPLPHLNSIRAYLPIGRCGYAFVKFVECNCAHDGRNL